MIKHTHMSIIKFKLFKISYFNNKRQKISKNNIQELKQYYNMKIIVFIILTFVVNQYS